MQSSSPSLPRTKAHISSSVVKLLAEMNELYMDRSRAPRCTVAFPTDSAVFYFVSLAAILSCEPQKIDANDQIRTKAQRRCRGRARFSTKMICPNYRMSPSRSSMMPPQCIAEGKRRTVEPATFACGIIRYSADCRKCISHCEKTRAGLSKANRSTAFPETIPNSFATR